MEAVYAVLGIFLGIAIDEVVRKRRAERGNRVVSSAAAPPQCCRFIAQDYYDL